MDTPKRNDPKDTQAVGDATTPGLAPPGSGNPVPVVDLATSGDAAGGPEATGGGSENSDHSVPNAKYQANSQI